jgi:hypothetical protein
MSSTSTRRQFVKCTASAIPALFIAPPLSLAGQEAKPVTKATLTQGDLKVTFRDNSQSPRILSGLASLVNQRDAPNFEIMSRRQLKVASSS